MSELRLWRDISLTVSTRPTALISVTGFVTLIITNTNCKVWICRVEAVGVAEAVGAAEAVVLIS